MNFQKDTFLLLLMMILNVNSKCYVPTTIPIVGNTMVPTGFQSTGDPFNRVKTDVRRIVTTAVINQPPTTTIPLGSCRSFSTISYSYGYDGYVSGVLVPFSIELSKIKEIQVFSDTSVNAFTIVYTNGTVFTVGNPSNANIKKTSVVNLEDREVIGVFIREFASINSIQFYLHNLIDDSYEWTNNFGSYYGYTYLIPGNIDHVASNFKITKMFGSADNVFIKTLQFNYNYDICNRNDSQPPIPSPPPPPATTTLPPPTTTVPIVPNGSCLDINGKSPRFGTIRFALFAKDFSIRVSDLTSIEVYSTEIVEALVFHFKNGQNLSYGRPISILNYDGILINLENKEIFAININSGLMIDRLQFLILDPSNQQSGWTDSLGGKGGDLNFIDAVNFAPSSSNFRISYIAGHSDPYNGIQELKFGYIYKQCNPAVPNLAKIPSTPIPVYQSTSTKSIPSYRIENDITTDLIF